MLIMYKEGNVGVHYALPFPFKLVAGKILKCINCVLIIFFFCSHLLSKRNEDKLKPMEVFSVPSDFDFFKPLNFNF